MEIPGIIKFKKTKDYEFVKELGQGACGITILMHDPVIDALFVCKKFSPATGVLDSMLFSNFIREIQLLHEVYHPNVVRVFDYYLFEKENTGYIIMEYIKGSDIESFTKQQPEKINDLFIQTIEGFRYLESNTILHRDIRPQNILVSDDGTLKIIDFGFGKKIETTQHFDKSINLNWWCRTPQEFSTTETYSFTTELYFVGKLFEKIIKESNIVEFNYHNVLSKMCEYTPEKRIKSFNEVDRELAGNKFSEIHFSESEMEAYRYFSNFLHAHFKKISSTAIYIDDIEVITTLLDDAYKCMMLETYAPDASLITRCFINGEYFYKKQDFPVDALKDFIRLFKSVSYEKKRIIVANIYTKLDSIARYTEQPIDDVPF